jgi:hypothetical protein
MCSPATCRTCSRTTWAGCGKHVDQVMARVPEARRCTCAGTDGSSQPAQRSQRSTLLQRVLGR